MRRSGLPEVIKYLSSNTFKNKFLKVCITAEKRNPQTPLFVCTCLGSHRLKEQGLLWLVTVIQVVKWTIQKKHVH